MQPRDYYTPARQTFLKRIQQRIDTDLLLAAACGVFLGWLCAQFI